MKPGRITVLIVSALLFTFTLYAGNVDEAKAKKAALNHYRHYAPASKKQASITKVKEYKWGDRTSFYICSFDKGGFVLVSANDAVTPVLGYGFDYGVPDEITNEAVKGWFDNYARQIDTAFVLNLRNEATITKWDRLLDNRFPKSSEKSVDPLLTTLWDQGCYYNDNCPTDQNGPCAHTWTGCVATAMAQILKYWNYPPKGIGYNEYYIPLKPQYGKISAFFNQTEYDWNHMPDVITDNDSAVSTLLFHCGVAVNMQYDPNGSGAYSNDVKDALVNYFDYDPGMQYSMTGPADSNEFYKIKAELDSLRPVYIRASDHYSSHAFVCDGYDSSGYFHFNYGWSGYANGYYTIYNLYSGLNYNHGVLTGIKPNYSRPKADFKVVATDSNLVFHFINYSRGNLLTTSWDFGDGMTSLNNNPINNYDTSGFYNVKLVVCDSNECDTIIKNIAAFELLYALNEQFLGTSNLPALSGDFDNDNDLDILVDAWPEGNVLLKVDSIGITPTTFGVPQGIGNFTTGDFDNDGDMDLLYSSGYIGLGFGFTTKLYKNDSNCFSEVPISLPDVFGVAKFIDFDNDGKTDISLIGNGRFYLFKNTGESFIQIDQSLGYLPYQGSEWADLDTDGYKDLIVSGTFDNLVGTRIFKNMGDGSFTLIVDNLDPNNYFGFCGTVKAVDIDKDNKTDIIVSGDDYYLGPRTYVFINKGNWIFEKYTDSTFSVFASPDIQVIDFNGDKTIDIVLGSKLFSNPGNATFIDYPSNLIDSKTLCFDYNHDKRPDIFGWGTNIIGKFYENINNSTVSTLEPPSILMSTVTNNDVNLRWDRAKFGLDRALGVSYNIRIGKTINGIDVLSPESDISSGFRKRVDIGNVGYDTVRTINNLTSGKYYWSIQAIDYSYNGSPFSIVDSFNVINKLPPEVYAFTRDFYLNRKNHFVVDDFKKNFLSLETDTLLKIKFSSLPLYGSLFFNNTPVTINQVISSDSIPFIYYISTTHLKDTIYWNAFDGNSYAVNSKQILIDNLLFEPVLTCIPKSLSAFSWGDYDNDGDIDIASDFSIFKNTNGLFQEVAIVLSGSGDVNWGDTDDDGDLDIAIGEKIFQNNGNDQFNLTQSLAPCLAAGTSAFGDLYNNNNLDYLYSGEETNLANFQSRLHLNAGQGLFLDSTINLMGLKESAVSWGDYDNDGKQDIILSGRNGQLYYSQKTIIYHNENGQLVDIHVNMPNVNLGTLDWGDFDRDGDLDLLLSGYNGIEFVQITKIFRNDNGSLSEFNPDFYIPGVSQGFAKWIDTNADGYLDIIFCGVRNSGRRLCNLFRNNSGISFTEVMSTGLPSLADVSIAIGDYNNDGYTDFILSGINENCDTITSLYRNGLGSDSVEVNISPSIPLNLSSVQISDSSISLSWNRSTDNTTPQAAITYNLYIGTSPDSTQVMSPLADLTTGYRKIPKRGNVDNDTTWIIKRLSPGTYYWSVQAIDNSFAGGPFAPVDSFTVVNVINQEVTLSAGWNIASFYVRPFQLSTDSVFSPIMASGDLVKAINEAGGFIQNIPGIGWMNTVGDMENTEGYYIKMDTEDTLSLSGAKVNLPFEIPLQTGWNIMGYPVQMSQDALNALQPIINSGSLTKVINESGGFIQNIPGMGWLNTIGDFEPGEGYYIKVSSNDTLAINDPIITGTLHHQFIEEGTFYRRATQGNPYLPMHIVANFNDNIQLAEGDELAVFAGDQCLGSSLVEDFSAPVAVFLTTDDPTTEIIDGGQQGDMLIFKLLHQGKTYLLECQNHQSVSYEPLETQVVNFTTTWLDVSTTVTTGFKVSEVIPNPFSTEARIYVTIPETGNLKIEVLDLRGVVIKTLFEGEVLAQELEVKIEGKELRQGMYFIHVRYNNENTQEEVLRKVVMNER